MIDNWRIVTLLYIEFPAYCGEPSGSVLFSATPWQTYQSHTKQENKEQGVPPLKQLTGNLHLRELLCALHAMLLIGASAQAETPRIFAITDVRIVTAPGQVIDQGTVVLRDGLIESVGTGVVAPPDARIINGRDNWSVYPAFIDAASAVALTTEPANGSSGRPNGNSKKQRPGSPHELEAVHPEQAVVDQLDVSHTSIGNHRELGFAVAHVLPDKGVFRGESAVILLRKAPASKLILVDRLSQVIALETSSFMARKYPSSSIGAVATVRQTFLDAQRQLIWNERFANNPVGMRRPEYRASDTPLLAALQGERSVVFVSGARLDPGRFNSFATEFKLHALTVADGLGHRFEDLRAAHMPILLPLELPEEPDLNDADEARDTTLREMQALVRAPSLPMALTEADMEFAFVTAGMKSARNFSENLAAVVAAGLSPEQALASITTVPARLLGLDSTLGTIEPGKQANLLIVEGDLFAEKPALRHMFVDGYHEEIDAEETIGDPSAVEDPRGTWEVTTEVMGRSSDSKWTITGSQDKYTGFSESSRTGKNQFKSVKLVGNALTVVSGTPRGEIDITVIVSDDTLKGETTMESPRGSAKMEIEGRRISGPESSEQ